MIVRFESCFRLKITIDLVILVQNRRSLYHFSQQLPSLFLKSSRSMFIFIKMLQVVFGSEILLRIVALMQSIFCLSLSFSLSLPYVCASVVDYEGFF